MVLGPLATNLALRHFIPFLPDSLASPSLR